MTFTAKVFMRLRPKRSTLAILLTAAVLGFALSEFQLRSGLITTQEEVDELVGLGFEDGITMLRSPKSLNSVAEYTYDFDHDNRIDSHAVSIFEGQNQHASYHSDEAGELKRNHGLTVTLGRPESDSALQLKNDGTIDVLTVLLRDHGTGEAIHIYADRNLDGLMDDMLLREPDIPMKWFILLNGTWINSDGGGGDGWVTTRSIDEGGDEQQRVNFDGTKWVRANDTGDAEEDVPRPAR